MEFGQSRPLQASGSTKLEVAKATIRGMMLSDCRNVNVEMMHDEDVFKTAYDEMRTEFLPPKPTESSESCITEKSEKAAAATETIKIPRFPPPSFEEPSSSNAGIQMFKKLIRTPVGTCGYIGLELNGDSKDKGKYVKIDESLIQTKVVANSRLKSQGRLKR